MTFIYLSGNIKTLKSNVFNARYPLQCINKRRITPTSLHDWHFLLSANQLYRYTFYSVLLYIVFGSGNLHIDVFQSVQLQCLCGGSDGIGTGSTVETLYNTVNFCWSTHKRHSIARPKGRGMGCLLWVQRATYCIDLSKLSSIKYLL